MTRLTELPNGLQLCPRCEERAFRPAPGVAACRKCAPSVVPVPVLKAKTSRGSRKKSADLGTSQQISTHLGAVAIAATVVVPFTSALSKNAMWQPVGRGHMIVREESAAARKSVADAIRAALAGARATKRKLHVALMVFKPTHRMDAINFGDVICDAVQDATGLNDRWYTLEVDWAIDRETPRIEITISQGDEGK